MQPTKMQLSRCTKLLTEECILPLKQQGLAAALQTAYEITRRGGTTVAAGMPGPEAEINLSHLKIAAEERCLRGSYMGSCVAKRDIPRYLNMFQSRLFTC
jgi:alcohol dehydrogenase